MTDETTTTTARRQEALDTAAALVYECSMKAFRAYRTATDAGNTESADAAKVAEHKALEAQNLLVGKLGARNPLRDRHKMIGGESASLAALARLEESKPDAAELLAALETAQTIAERVDAKRGKVIPDHLPTGPGESRGTDLAETISELCLRLRREIHGAQGLE